MRDTTFSILKGLAIILVVVCHSGAPSFVNDFIFQFHVPAFFFCAGYFFSDSNLTNVGGFLGRRVKNLYVPFVKWSLLFLVLHNLFFLTGLLSEQYGNASGGVLHPYTWTGFFQRVWSVVFNMSGYDEFICGTFWFFRTLFIGSIGFLVLMLLFRKLRPTDTMQKTAALVAVVAFLLILWKIGAGLKVTGVAGGGYRELLAIIFMSGGYLFRKYKDSIRANWLFGFVCLVVTVLGACFFPSNMGYTANFGQFFSLLLPAGAGFGLLYYISLQLNRSDNGVKAALVYVGDRTLYIFVFHLLAFKLVSAVKIAVEGLPWGMMGCHTVIPPGEGNLWWVLYTIVGVAVPLGCLKLYNDAASRIDLSYTSCAKYALNGLIWLGCAFVTGCKKCGVAIWSNILGFVKTMGDIIRASNPKDE